MIKKLLPIVLLVAGSGAGVGAGIYLRQPEEAPGHSDSEVPENHGRDHATKEQPNRDAPPTSMEYLKLNNQFVIPIVKDQRVSALVVLALSLEVPEGEKDQIFKREPKLRDSFLQVLFDHANVGGFEGAFTDAANLKVLRRALLEIAQRDLGADLVSDVLILDIARQDY